MSHPLSSSSGPPSSSGGVAAGPVVPAAAAVVAAVAVPAGTVPTAAVAVAPNEFPIHPVNVLHASMHRHMQQQMQAAAARSLHLSQTPGPSEQSAPEATNRPVPNELIQSFANQGVLLAQSILSGMPPQGSVSNIEWI
jgi:hypothetical protein